APSTIFLVSSGDSTPEYIPANCGWLSSMMLFSIDVVENGQPIASIAARASFCNPRREIVKAGNATTDFALFRRSVMAATAFCRDVSLDFGVKGRTSAGVTGACA